MKAREYFKLHVSTEGSVLGMFEDEVVKLMKGFADHKMFGHEQGSVVLDLIPPQPMYVFCECETPEPNLDGTGQWICEKCYKRVLNMS
jgi:hypothetical protein